MQLEPTTLKTSVKKLMTGADYKTNLEKILKKDFKDCLTRIMLQICHAKIDGKKMSFFWYKKVFVDFDKWQKQFNRKDISKDSYDLELNSFCISFDAFKKIYKILRPVLESDISELPAQSKFSYNSVTIDFTVFDNFMIQNILIAKFAIVKEKFFKLTERQISDILMLTLCKLFQVPEEYYNAENFVRDKTKDVDREVDFYLKSNGQLHKCEVKLMGAGNTESADAVIARGSEVFIAESMSQQNKAQFDQLGVSWVALRDENGFRQFKLALEKFNIPHIDYNGDLDKDLAQILDEVL